MTTPQHSEVPPHPPFPAELQSQEDLQVQDDAFEPRLDEMQGLLRHADRFAAVVRDELRELSSTRDAFLAAVERDGEQRRRKALASAEKIIADAEAQSRETIQHASLRAAEITAEARSEYERLVDANAQYREALIETVSVLAGLPEVPKPVYDVSVEVVLPQPPMHPAAAHRLGDAERRST